jgi:hypothetical protein
VSEVWWGSRGVVSIRRARCTIYTTALYAYTSGITPPFLKGVRTQEEYNSLIVVY